MCPIQGLVWLVSNVLDFGSFSFSFLGLIPSIAWWNIWTLFRTCH
ncbi:hypothetical protein POPTR_003G195500v4 [Populus trichocarpa]|uniref:Uncharacterized protein n=1 Tax=Populus trichocarpa TaxID=3694 RepID=A0ACC0TAC5_POPTR|nr:hypothetical protein BDE02_03G179400 [Populus trichocarpa]KAI9398547.1 hypothetical protein POPTR_003G195500v4 [Populus trichocarpa]